MTKDDDNRKSPDQLNQAFFEHNSGKVTDRHLDRIIEKAIEIKDKVKNIPSLHKLLKDVQLCLELIRDYRSGAYKDIAPWAIAAVVFGLLYLVNPVELIPDVIPVVGYMDDVAVLALILKLVKTELEKYAAWRKTLAEYEDTFSGLSDRD
ncbi:MAG: YkvA family protein [Methylobacter sp.]|uniref:YkvA family protein n=1 Tax=Methylobacter sp. TaxID=2051955 RepID=UPI0025864E61|nr:YkvA family protein [Methylobacter sp.]MCL7422431.1 YkvA family protein [Methylobacter sp.]